jgi:hypothetical protein
MRKANWMALLTIGMLLPVAAFADDESHSSTNSDAPPVVTLSVDPLHTESLFPSRWQLPYSIEDMPHLDDWPQPIADFDFEDASALARVSKLQSLSLLTLAEVGQTRVFLGVDDKGLVGLHFNVFVRDLSESSLEIARMPYLKEKEPDGEVELVVAESN